ncbi:sugar ABC transporter ATP-binding protein [Arsenicicoccus bolidensis]|uniref:sugar ABC transporter ATP-binding protein n=1 Tax=Arsenicicoccus bolidensis TaxID=229480 RepID=UPI0028AB7636|nr:sugar ABC transporter ATP-binding protein [Arsenicicoccus bolidensis]
MPTPLLAVRDATKSFGGVRALRGASLEVTAGEVHGLLGPNGSGKSTLNKVVAGSVRPDSATIHLDGAPVTIDSPMAAHRLGISAVYQQLSLVPQLSVADNPVLGLEPTRLGLVRGRQARERAGQMLDTLQAVMGAPVRLDDPVRRLTPAQQQLVEVGKALLRDPRILILDEATASLHRDQVALLRELVEDRRRAGCCIIFVSHRLHEIVDFCDRATILRSGSTVATVDARTTTPDEMIRLMVGDVGDVTRRGAHEPTGDVRLEMHELTSPGIDAISLAAERGEIVGLGGLQGQGQSELLLTLFGAMPATSGTVSVDGREVDLSSPVTAARAGIALVPGDRNTQGLFAKRSVQDNISIASVGRRATAGLTRQAVESSVARDMVERLRIAVGNLGQPVSTLSGGNAQKVVLAKWILNEPAVLLLDDPTKGVDIGAKEEIYRIIRSLADDGAVVVINSSEDSELVALCDRVLVLYEGAVVETLTAADLTEERLVGSSMRVPATTAEEAE